MGDVSKLTSNEKQKQNMTADNHIKEFADMRLSEPVLAGLKNTGFLKPSSIQLAAIPLAKDGFDVSVLSKCGTGKPVYVVTALEMMQVEMQALQVRKCFKVFQLMMMAMIFMLGMFMMIMLVMQVKY